MQQSANESSENDFKKIHKTAEIVSYPMQKSFFLHRSCPVYKNKITQSIFSLTDILSPCSKFFAVTIVRLLISSSVSKDSLKKISEFRVDQSLIQTNFDEAIILSRGFGPTTHS